jgi:hypothetical protein
LLGTPALGSVIDSPIFINELHYDNDGTDQGEFVEVAAPLSWRDLSAITLTLYNGGNGQSYGGPTPLSSFTRRDVAGLFAFYTLDVSLQNGAPDGLALAQNDQVLQFLSYEGTFTAQNGVAQDLLSTDIGVREEPNTPLGSSLQLSGRGDSYQDFTWELLSGASYGAVNARQTMLPEPASVVAWLIGLSALGWARRARRGRADRSP